MGPLTYLNFCQQIEAIDERFHSEQKIEGRALTDGLAIPLWNFSNEDIEPIVAAAFNHNNIAKIQILDANQKILIEKTSPKFASLQWDLSPTAFNKSQFAFQRLKIMRGPRTIGEALVWTSFKAHLAKKRSLLIATLLTDAFAIILIFALTMTLFRKSLLLRIRRLQDQFRELTLLKVDQSFTWSAGDKIDSLGQYLDQTRISLKTSLEESRLKSEQLARINQDLESQIKERSLRLVESSRLVSLGEMAGGVAHEINNPLTIIGGKTERLRRMVQSSNLDSEALLRELLSIDKTVSRIAKIIKGLRSFSREGSDDPFEEMGLAPIVLDSLELCRSKFSNSGVEVRVPEISADLRIECRPVQIGQIILNLLSNSHDAVASLNEKWIEIGFLDDGAEIVISVKDSGKGIPFAVQEKLMQPFFTTKGVGQGTGLGLSICKGIALSHGGQFTFDAESPNTCFRLRLPKKQSPTSTNSPKVA